MKRLSAGTDTSVGDTSVGDTSVGDTSVGDDGSAVKLKRRFGLPYCIAILVGFIIGSGIYIAPSGVMRRVSSSGIALVLWTLAGLLAMLGALTNAELGTTYPTSGDKYVYMQEFYGDFLGFLYLWQYLLIGRPGANTIKCLIFAQYVTYPYFVGCDPPQWMIRCLATALACVVTVVNCINVTWAGKLQGFCATLTVAALLTISITGFVYIGKGDTFYLDTAMDPTGDMDLGGLLLAFYSLVFTYAGWFALNFMVEELKDPYRNLPRAIILSMVIVTILYMCTNIAYITVLGPDGIRHSEVLAMDFAYKALGAAAIVMPILIAINSSGSLNGGILVGSRLCFAGARQGHLPAVLSHIHIKSFSPITALIMQLGIMILMCFFADVFTLINNFTFLNTAVEMLVSWGLVYRRYKEPNRRRPLKLPLAIPVVFAIASTLLVFGPLITKPQETGLGLAIVLCSGVPYYFLFVKRVVNLTFLDHYRDGFTVFVQKILLCVPQEHTPKDCQ